MQGAFEIQQDVLIDHLNEIVELYDAGPKETKPIERYWNALDKIVKKIENLRKLKNNKELNKAVESFIVAPDIYVKNLAKDKIYNLIADAAEDLVDPLVQNLSRYSGDYAVEDSVYELLDDFSASYIVQYALDEALENVESDLER